MPLFLLAFLTPVVVGAETPIWPQWRGPRGTGVAEHANPPVEWSEQSNVRWKVAIPGRGHSSPIVWGNRVFLTTAIPYGDMLPPKYSGAPGAHDNLPIRQRHRFVALALDLGSGKVTWQKTLHETLPHEGAHYTASLASASPVTDGEHVYAYFGSHGLFCLNFAGDVIWNQNLGKMQTKHGHGEGSSPALHGDTLVVNWDHEGASFVVALDKATGKQRWRVHRDEVTSWSTPIVVPVGDDLQVIVCGTERVRAYDLKTGRVIWECGGMSNNIVATPVAAEGMVFVGSSYEKRILMAIRLSGARGDITNSDHVVWSVQRGTPYVPSPLLYGDALYYLTHYQGILTRVHAKTGEAQPGAMRLGRLGNIYASPVAAANRVYVTDQEGVTAVITHDAIPRVLAWNELDDRFSASVAIAGDSILLRGDQHLYRLSGE